MNFYYLHKSLITNHKSQITNHKSQISSPRLAKGRENGINKGNNENSPIVYSTTGGGVIYYLSAHYI